MDIEKGYKGSQSPMFVAAAEVITVGVAPTLDLFSNLLVKQTRRVSSTVSSWTFDVDNCACWGKNRDVFE